MNRSRALAAVTLIAAALGAGSISCTQVGADPNAIVALAFDSLPYPAVIAGDSLRNEAGVATALSATGFNADGDEIPDAPFAFFALDAGATISADGFVLSTGTEAASIRVVAQAPGGLRSGEITLRVTPRPDSIALDNATDTVNYVSAAEVTTPDVVVQVLSNAIAPAPTVNGWVVRYQVEYNGTVLPASDATTAWTLDESGRRTAEDTTTTGGLASRRVRFRPAALGNPADSLVVIATAVRYGTPLVGSPLRVVVHLRPQ